MCDAQQTGEGEAMPAKTLDTKLAKILSDPSCGEFLLADAKDADMAAGMAAQRLQKPYGELAGAK